MSRKRKQEQVFEVFGYKTRGLSAEERNYAIGEGVWRKIGYVVATNPWSAGSKLRAFLPNYGLYHRLNMRPCFGDIVITEKTPEIVILDHVDGRVRKATIVEFDGEVRRRIIRPGEDLRKLVAA